VGTIWLTGLPGAGKSTVAAAVRDRLTEQGRPAVLLDGDQLRRGLSRDLGFSAADRSENARRTAHVALLLARDGVVALAALVSPFAADRSWARRLHADAGIPFIEVWMATPPEECERRDPKGLWARARAGELSEFTGVDHPYEPPASPELTLGAELAAADAVGQVLRRIQDG